MISQKVWYIYLIVWYKFLRQIKKKTCDRFIVYNDGIIEICLNLPNQQYFKDSEYNINYCYNVRTPNKDYYQCCQF